MMEALYAFPQIGWIDDYRALPPGERAIVNGFVLQKLQDEARTPAIKIDVPRTRKGG
ncbi:MAG: hypothetical protein LBQ15_07210 [Clostridium sp.]|jgi:hypothetical protein|nr:hypothetical protein [Clostridium sp.]